MHPLSLLFYGLIVLASASIVVLVHFALERGRPIFGQAGLALLASLPALAFLGAFSIGGWIALASLPFAIGLPLLSGSYRRPLAALAAINLAVAGFWTQAAIVLRPALATGLTLAGLYAAWRVVGAASGRRPADGWLLALPACLGGLALLLVAASWPWLYWLPAAAAILTAGLALWQTRYRLALLGLLGVHLLLAWSLLAS
jgi:hypothetical protein